MKAIEFRGLSTTKNHWLYGYYNNINGKAYIFPEDALDSYDNYRVDPDTVGQYTGVVDKNGKQVFEDDIIGYTDTDTGKTEIFGVVKWHHEGNFYINTDTYCNYTSDNNCANVGYMMNRATTKLHVLGNIHDNPDLLKGGENG